MFYICIDDIPLSPALDADLAWSAYCKAREFADLVGLSVVLCDSETGEVIADNGEE